MTSMDITDQFVARAINGGALGLFFYILIIVRCFRYLGLARAATKDHSATTEILLWCLGSALFAHIMAQFTVSYFDQIHVPWLGLLAIISSTTSSLLAAEPAPASMAENSEPSPSGSTEETELA
jgi:hypothetical protein